MTDEELKIYRGNQAEIVWREMCRVETSIQYSSLICERISSRSFKRFYKWLAFFMALPALIDILKQTKCIKATWIFWTIDVVYILVPAFVGLTCIEFIKKYLVFGDNEKAEFLSLNEDLGSYMMKLKKIYMCMEAAPSEKRVKDLMKEYEHEFEVNQKYMTKHDDITGELDDKLVEIARDKADKVLSQIRLTV